MGHKFDDTFDHLITGSVAIIAIIGAIVINIHTGNTPDWLVAISAAASGFYFRGRVNGQYNKSKMTELDDKLRRMKDGDEE